MAVAGPQTADVVAAIKAKKATGGVFAIGVDVDQSGIYGGTVLTSAVKGLEAATKATLNAITGSGSTVAADKVYDLTSNVGTDMFVGSIPNKQYITSAIQSDYNAFYLKANNDLKITSGNANFIDFAADKV